MDGTTAPQATGKKKKVLAKGRLTKEQRSQIMTEAANQRWARAREAKAKAAKAASGRSRAKKVVSGPREFSTALRTAEVRLAKAITERATAAARYAVLSAEIPSLQRLILALQNPLGMVSEYGTPGVMLAPTLEQIVGDQPILYQNPLPRRTPEPGMPQVPVPQELHPANTMGRAGGGAIGGMELAEEDEDQFLKDPAGPAGGPATTWH
jgi:hypothetical protein